MSDGSHGDRDRTFALADRANQLMRDYGPSASPRAYTVWYTYVSGAQPLMNDAIKRLTTQSGCLTNDDIDSLHDTYIDGRRLSVAAEKMSASVLSEIEGITEMLDLSLGSTAQYGESLRAFSHDLAGATLNRVRIREIVAALVTTTREVAANNRTLEARMRESRSEIESLRETLEATRIESLTDPLTGLSNRTLLIDRLEQALAKREGDRGSVAVLYFDVDRFKAINDSLGHEGGDRLLVEVAERLRGALRPSDTVARFGGDEFVLIARDLPGEAAAVSVARRVAAAFAEPFVLCGQPQIVSVSIGVTMANGRRASADDLLREADAAMYRTPSSSPASSACWPSPASTPRCSTSRSPRPRSWRSRPPRSPASRSSRRSACDSSSTTSGPATRP
jgi:diguanylate cyclase